MKLGDWELRRGRGGRWGDDFDPNKSNALDSLLLLVVGLDWIG